MNNAVASSSEYDNRNAGNSGFEKLTEEVLVYAAGSQRNIGKVWDIVEVRLFIMLHRLLQQADFFNSITTLHVRSPFFYSCCI